MICPNHGKEGCRNYGWGEKYRGMVAREETGLYYYRVADDTRTKPVRARRHTTSPPLSSAPYSETWPRTVLIIINLFSCRISSQFLFFILGSMFCKE